MRFPRNARIFRGQLDAAPFAGVFFLLVLFLLLTALVYTPGGVPLQLPRADDLPASDKPTVAIGVDANGRLYFENLSIEEAQLSQRLGKAVKDSAQPLTLVVQADKAVTYDTMVHLWSLAREAGIADVVLATLDAAVPLAGACYGAMSTGASAERRRWPASRWCSLIALVFGLQVACIFWLSDRTPLTLRVQAPVPVLYLAGPRWAELLALGDPTWFALPYRQGFSGLAWAKAPAPEFYGFSYTNLPELLRLSTEQPGVAFYEFIHTNDFGSSRASASTELALTLPELVPLPLSGERSELRLEGELAHRPLLTRFELQSKSSAVLLTNSVVQVVVDAAGRTQTAALLKSSGSAEKDQEALEKAAVARFAPLVGGGSSSAGSLAPLTSGLLVFAWHTLPIPSSSSTTSDP